AGDIEGQIRALSNFFDGVNETNINLFIVGVKSDLFELTANEGHSFGDPMQAITVISSKPASTTVETINVYSNDEPMDRAKYEKNKADYNTANETEKRNILARMFVGINTTNVSKFKVSFDDKNYTFVLTALPGFTFTNQAGIDVGGEIKSNNAALIKLEYSSKLEITLLEFHNAKSRYDSALGPVNLSEQLAALQTLFVGLTSITDLHNIEVSIETNQFVLRAKPGYTFGENGDIEIMTIMSVVPVLIELNITPVARVTASEFLLIQKEYTEANGDVAKQISALKKLFEGINNVNFEYFKIIHLPDTNFSLMIKGDFPWFTFGEKDKEIITHLSSSQITANNTKLDIIKKSDKLTTTEFTALKNRYETNAGSSTIIIEVLKSVFEGPDLITSNLKYFKISVSNTNFTLTTELGYTFGEPSGFLVEKITSENPIELEIIQNILPKTGITIK
ncbi:MAG: hypothetical protein KFW07_01555, partial [Mycoplasmataceae bacterium]|nr:hypothetical protein [Mycoplasmataceae bacterium]